LWCEVDLHAIAENIEQIRKKTDKKIFAVVKCNAYGLGIEAITDFLNDKADGFVVSDIDEALKVKSKKPVLILQPQISDKDIPKIMDNFVLTIDDASQLEKLKDRPYTVHIFVDTGMHRFGVKPEHVDGLIDKIKEDYPNIAIDGIYTHLHHPLDKKYTRKQLATFEKVVEKHRSTFANIHVLNSAGFLNYNDISFDNCIRVGNLLYGTCGPKYGFKKVYSYKTKIISTSIVDKNEFIGYGNRYKTKKKTQIGILGVGFIHGFNCSKNLKLGFFSCLARTVYHAFKREPLVFYKGKPVEILGECSMNFTTVNLDGITIDGHSVFDIQLSSVLADGTIPKKYLL